MNTIIKKYEYKFIKVERQAQKEATFKECKLIIVQKADHGWRLTQVVTDFNEKLSISSACGSGCDRILR